jgi:addiction module HigA family antidote
MNPRTPAEIFPPGEFIKDELKARGWTQDVLAEVMGRPRRLVSELISAKKQLTPETARGLAAAFGTDPQLWMDLESAYRLSKTSSYGSGDVSRRAELYELMKSADRAPCVDATAHDEAMGRLERACNAVIQADGNRKASAQAIERIEFVTAALEALLECP